MLIERIFVDWYWILKIKHNGHTLNLQWTVAIFWQATEEDYLFMQSMLVHTEEDLGPYAISNMEHFVIKKLANAF